MHTLLDTPRQMLAWSSLHRKGKLSVRVVAIPHYDSIGDLHRHGIGTGFGDDMLRIGAGKLFSDGSLGADGVALRPVRRQTRDTRHSHLRSGRPQAKMPPTPRPGDFNSRFMPSAIRRCEKRSTRSNSPSPAKTITSIVIALNTRRCARRIAWSGWPGEKSSRRFSRSLSPAIRGRHRASGPSELRGVIRSSRCSAPVCR